MQAVEASEDQRVAIDAVNEALAGFAARQTHAYLAGPNGERLPLPAALFQILRHAAIMLHRGERVVLSPVDKEISSQEAADLLNVSRPYLVQLLERDEIPSHKTGRYRRIRFGDAVAYKDKRNRTRREKLGEMIRNNYASGMYNDELSKMPDTR